MTATPDAPRDPDHDDLRPAVQRLLREPVEVDAARREAAIRAALDAAPRAATTPAQQRSRRAWSGRPVLVAASLVAVVGIGIAAVLSVANDPPSQLATGAASTDDRADSAGGAGGAAQEDAIAPGAPESSRSPLTPEEQPAAGAPTTTAPFGPTVPDLGEHDATGPLLAEARELLAGDGTTAGGTTEGDPSREPDTCRLQLLAQGWQTVARATVRSTPVLVASGTSGELLVVDDATCAPYDAP